MREAMAGASVGRRSSSSLCAMATVDGGVLALVGPTRHLDFDNVCWVEAWHGAFPGSIMGTSSLSSVEKCLGQFVVKHPQKKFTFPEPDIMEGVESRSRVFPRMNVRGMFRTTAFRLSALTSLCSFAAMRGS